MKKQHFSSLILLAFTTAGAVSLYAQDAVNAVLQPGDIMAADNTGEKTADKKTSDKKIDDATQNENKEDKKEANALIVMPRIDVVGTKEEIAKTASTINIIDKNTLEESRVLNVNEALRKAPGINARDEEGIGLRPNIGIRGLNPTRSTKTTMLEDGIPLSYAPYGDNASYYHPGINRYDHIEILKGSNQILFGPQTIGGVINYVTPSISRKPAGMMTLSGGKITGGEHDYANGGFYYSNQGMRLDYYRLQSGGARDNMYSQLNDFNAKTVVSLAEDQALTLRASSYTENSMMTYSGLTEAEYRKQGSHYNPFDNDEFTGRRYGASATHELDINENATLLTNVYGAQFARDWWRQSSTTTDSQCGNTFTAARMAGQKVDPDTCNSRQGRLREYRSGGIEPRLRLTHFLFGIENELQTGTKFHFEEQDRKQKNGTSPTASDGVVVENNDRRTTAYSGFILNRFILGNWSIEPGTRYEYIQSNRDNNLVSGAQGNDTLDRLIPGVGVAWNPNETLTVFSGVHRGFAPPRTEDLIGGTGTSTDVGAEESVNWEAGFRHQPMTSTHWEASIFRNDFSNLIAVGSIAGGNTPLAEGEALFQGLEFFGEHQFDNGIYLRQAYTWLETAEQTSPFVSVANGAVVGGSKKGNRQPYAPEHNLNTTLGFKRGQWDFQIERVHVDDQYSDFANTKVAAINGNGQNGEIDAYTVFNAAINFNINKKTTVFLTSKNLENNTYIVDRTRGIQVGMPRLLEIGFQYGI